MNENHVYDMIIVGGGPGGYTSALYAARAGFDTIVLGFCPTSNTSPAHSPITVNRYAVSSPTSL